MIRRPPRSTQSRSSAASDVYYMLDPHRLRFLRELSVRGTISATAQSLAYTPSAVSQALSALERDIGTKLLERRGRNVVLTPAGASLVESSDAVFSAPV